MPDEPALLQARLDALRLRELASGLGSSSTALTRRLATLHGLQVNVLESVLRSGGVPPAEIAAAVTGQPSSSSTTSTASPTAMATATATATDDDTASPTTSVSPGVTELIRAEAEGLTTQALSDLAKISEGRVALFGSMTAQRAAAVRLLGGRLPPAGTSAGPTGEPAIVQLEAIRSAVYGFEVVVAHTDPSRRAAAATTLGMLRSRSAELEVLLGPAAGPTPLGYALPFPVTTPASALRLATHVMTALRQSVAGQLPALSSQAPGLTGTVSLLADVVFHAVTWRVPLTAFPGLTNP